MNRRSHFTLCFALAITLALALFMPGAAAMAQSDDKPSVTASDQEIDGTLVSVDSVVAIENGWLVIHADANGKPGSVLGRTAVPAGMTENVIVVLDEPLTDSATLWAMLHVDKGEVGTYEFPDGPDVPATDGSAIVLAPFAASVPPADGATAEEAVEEKPAEEAMEEKPAEEAMEEKPAEEAMEEKPAEEAMEEEPAEEAMEGKPAEEAMEENAVDEAMSEETTAEETTAEDMPAPEQLPDTGSGPIGVSSNITVLLLMVLVLAGGLVVSRQRRD